MLLVTVRERFRSQARRLKRLQAASPAVQPADGLRPLAWNRRILPRYFTHDPADLHLWLNDYLDGLHARRGSRVAILAPREGAKSTWCTLGYVLRCAVEGWEPYILILSDSGEQANKLLFDLRAELEGNAALAAAYPAATGLGSGVWREGEVRLKNGVLIESLGRGAKVRGRRNRSARPSLIILDDVQSNRDIRSDAERTAAWDWFTREVIPAGTETTNFISVGTALHREAVAVRAGSLPGWTAQTFPAIVSWPENLELWAEWERLATDLADDDREATAAAFYESRREPMDRGAVTFWQARKPIAVLMAKRAEIGPNAFNTEYQGKPQSPVGAEWPTEYFDRPGLWFEAWPEQLLCRVQSLDPSKGISDTSGDDGDFQAHVLAGLGRDGTLYVEAVLAHETIPLMVARAIDLARASGFGHLDSLIVETNDVLGMLLPEFEAQLRARGMMVALESVTQSVNKIIRIRRLGIYFGRNRVRFRNTRGTRLLVEQLREFPEGSHDDGPDALEMAINRIERFYNPQ